MKLHQISEVIGATLGHVSAPQVMVQSLQGNITSSSRQVSRGENHPGSASGPKVLLAVHVRV